MIDIKNVKIDFKSTMISYEDFTFSKDKITFITGKNGTGKTTLLKALAGLIKYEGAISKSNSTYVSQNPILFHMSVMDNILYPIKIRKLDITNYISQVKEYAKILGLTDLLGADATKLSAGERMKTSIIRSIIFTPDYVLLDEPTTSLDEQSIKELTLLIKSLKKSIGFILVSHDRLFKNDLMEDHLELGGNYVQRQIITWDKRNN